MAGGKIPAQLSPAGLAGFYVLGSVQEPFTIYRRVRAVPAGSTINVDVRGVGTPKQYFSIACSYRQAESSPLPVPDGGIQEYLRDALLDSVRHHLVADVPVGAFLSGGVDSSTLVGLMRDVRQEDIQTVTVAFEEFKGKENDESPLAERTARNYGTRHTTRVFTEHEFRDELPKFIEAMDQPTIDGLNTWFVSKAAHELGLKVAISGLGGDELFGGYPSFRDVPRWVSLIKPVSQFPMLQSGFKRLVDGVNGHLLKLNPKVAGLLLYGATYPGAYLLRRGLYLPDDLGRLMGADQASEGLRHLQPLCHIERMLTPEPITSFGKIATMEASLYMRNQLLRDTDWTSMSHSLEVRLPLVDAKLLSQISRVTASLEKGRGKRLLHGSPRVRPPSEILCRSKTGFCTPLQAWLPRLQTTKCSDPWPRNWAQYVMSAWAKQDFEQLQAVG
jgi:asparagine synthase (glutamine-hydrolysing)